jgi:hypothetical protein
MPCLSVKITSSPLLLSKGRVEIKRTPPPPNISVTREHGIEINIGRATKGLLLSVSDVFKDNHLKASCGIVCGASDVRYLHVSPQEVQWITSDEAIIYMVESNTDWTIVIS